MYCGKCGQQLEDSARFCVYCGAPTAAGRLASEGSDTANSSIQDPVSQAEPQVIIPETNHEAVSSDHLVPAGKRIRYKCSCGNVADTVPGAVCSKCGRPQTEECGYYKLYRMGNFMGMGAALSIYIDNEPYGRIGNKQTCWIKLPYGTHLIHIAAGISRRCTDMQFTLSPDHPLECAKVHIRVGAVTNTYVIEPASNEDVPD